MPTKPKVTKDAQATSADEPKRETKQSKIIALLEREEGATITELMSATEGNLTRYAVIFLTYARSANFPSKPLPPRKANGVTVSLRLKQLSDVSQ